MVQYVREKQYWGLALLIDKIHKIIRLYFIFPTSIDKINNRNKIVIFERFIL